MYISFNIDNETSNSVFQYLDREDVFNVSITRAKQKQYLYYSFDPTNFKNRYLLIDYFAESQIFNTLKLENEYVDMFSHQVYNELLNLGIDEEKILVNHIIAGQVIDMMFTHKNKVICIDLVGYPGALEKTFSIEQYKTLFRTKVTIITIPYVYWLENKEACLQHISAKARVFEPGLKSL